MDQEPFSGSPGEKKEVIRKKESKRSGKVLYLAGQYDGLRQGDVGDLGGRVDEVGRGVHVQVVPGAILGRDYMR